MPSKYYAVIGNRDYIKYQGEKRPYWEFLDEQPDGYLSSIVYARKDCPQSPMIWDCGAWSYKDKLAPTFGKYLLTPGYALFEQYAKLARPGDMVIAPDHMLIDGVDLDHRREINRTYARDFILLCHKMPYIPMAAAHGMDLNERVESTKYLAGLGYNHIAIGGVAARAAQKTHVVEMITEIRKSAPNIWLHVLGLSSPPYAKVWNQIGINSYDGSSHFKQAFTGGAFFTIENGKLKKHCAARPDEEITAPKCTCTACSKLMEESIDTREYGSNENNMGRAAHNQNMLMKAQKIAINGTIVLVSCVGEKLQETSKAKDLYRSDWFIKARKYAEQNGDNWAILSAKHGLINPESEVNPYEQTLNTMPSGEREKWAIRVEKDIRDTVALGSRLVILAGTKYREKLIGRLHGYHVEIPMVGLGIGQQLAWLKAQTEKPEQMTLC
jgi:hypothetical protein